MRVRLPILWLLLVLSACAPYQGSLRERAVAAAARSEWEAAYRFAEDALLSDDSRKQAEAQAFIFDNPMVYDAAGKTFRVIALQDSVSRYGDISAYSIEKVRLSAYQKVASLEDYEKAMRNFGSVFDGVEEKQALRITQAARDEELEKAARIQRMQKIVELEVAARIGCRSELECKKVFALTEIFFSENSDMKIQISTGNVLETYNPTSPANIGLKAFKVPGRGESAEVALRVICAADASIDYCDKRKLLLYEAFPAFVKARLMN